MSEKSGSIPCDRSCLRCVSEAFFPGGTYVAVPVLPEAADEANRSPAGGFAVAAEIPIGGAPCRPAHGDAGTN